MDWYSSRVPHPVLLVVPLVVLVPLFVKIYRILTNPLFPLPGPTISKWTNVRLQLAVLTGERVRYVHSLHERYGPIVRISPTEVSLSDVASARTIYKVGGAYVKSDWYSAFTGNLEERNVFSMIDPRQHGEHRKLLSFHFSEKWIKNMEPAISAKTQLAVLRMQQDSENKGYFDVFKWFTFMATDIICEASFGESFRMLDTGKKDQYIHDLELTGKRGSIRAEFPTLAAIMKHMPVGSAKEIDRAVDRLRNYADASLERYWRQLRANPDDTKATLLTKEYAKIEDGTLSRGQLRRDAMGNIVAGTDTTALTATYVVWYLAQYPEIQEALIREVSTLPDGFHDEDLKSLRVLNNVIHETLRLRSVVSQSLPRVVPAGGAEFSGFFLPAGTIVGIQAWTMHRNPAVWPQPEHFDPSRWNDPTKEMKDSFVPFGGGSRICIGMHFAQLELRHALANFYRTFEVGVKLSQAEGFTEDDMLPMAFFLLTPKGKRCLVSRRK